MLSWGRWNTGRVRKRGWENPSTIAMTLGSTERLLKNHVHPPAQLQQSPEKDPKIKKPAGFWLPKNQKPRRISWWTLGAICQMPDWTLFWGDQWDWWPLLFRVSGGKSDAEPLKNTPPTSREEKSGKLNPPPPIEHVCHKERDGKYWFWEHCSLHGRSQETACM